VITRVLTLHAHWFGGVTDPQYVMQCGGEGFYSGRSARFIFAWEENCLLHDAGWDEGWNGGEYHEIVPQREDRYSLYFCRLEGNKASLRSMESNMRHRRCARRVIFEDLWERPDETHHDWQKPVEDARTAGTRGGMRPRKKFRSYCGGSEGEIKKLEF